MFAPTDRTGAEGYGMAQGDQLLATIEAVHAAALDAEVWPQALSAVTQLVGGVGTTLEVFHKPSQRHSMFYAVGLPTTLERDYLEHWAPISPRVIHGQRWRTGHVGWDYQFLDEAAMDRDPFYEEFLPRTTDFRYFVAGALVNSADEFAVLAVQRTRHQGHVGAAEITLMRQLVPHVQQALDVAMRLKSMGEAHHSLERALDWFADGVVLVGADGAVVYANEAVQAIARCDDGIRIRRGMIDFTAADARARLEAAIGAVRRLRSGDPRMSVITDFPVRKPSGAPPYLISVRPLLDKGREGRGQARAAAIIFIRDSVGRNAAATALLREVFGFTDSEASLAQALQGGVSLGDYARIRAVSLNTIYTHLRRIKEKTGCKRMAELIRKLNDLQVPLRFD
jgi:DNA-binding CsgD family transcriptional regulator